MISENEKMLVLGQMDSIMRNVTTLLSNYDDLKKYLFGHGLFLDNLPNHKADMEVLRAYDTDKILTNSNRVDYSKLSITVASILKDSGVPLSSKELHSKVVERGFDQLRYNNFKNNILSRISSDKNVNVEKVHRGFYQYRLKPL